MQVESIGTRIRFARKKSGLTQAQLAERAFISESYMALIESDRRNPSTDVVKKIAEVLGISADHLLFGSEAKNETTLFHEWKTMTTGRSATEIAAAQQIVKCFFDTLDNTEHS